MGAKGLLIGVQAGGLDTGVQQGRPDTGVGVQATEVESVVQADITFGLVTSPTSHIVHSRDLVQLQRKGRVTNPPLRVTASSQSPGLEESRAKVLPRLNLLHPSSEPHRVPAEPSLEPMLNLESLLRGTKTGVGQGMFQHLERSEALQRGKVGPQT